MDFRDEHRILLCACQLNESAFNSRQRHRIVPLLFQKLKALKEEVGKDHVRIIIIKGWLARSLWIISIYVWSVFVRGLACFFYSAAR